MALVCALTAMLVAAPAQAAPIPAPKQYFGFELGTTGKLARFSKIQSYLKLIGDNSNRADYFNLGTTTNGNEMPLLHVSSPANLAKVDQILAANDRLANPRGLSEEDAKALAADHIPVYYLEAGMHSTEVGPVQVIPNIVHRLATERSPEINRILNEMLIIVLPAANPDGSHLVTDFFNETAGTSMTRTYPDLYHHYTGHDDNRDWLFFTQLERVTAVTPQSTLFPAAPGAAGAYLVEPGSSGDTAKTLLNLPAEKVTLPTPFAIPGSLMRVQSDETVPEMWGMPREWTTWSDGDTGWRLTDTATAKAGSIYPNDAAPLLGAGYAAGADGLRGSADIATFEVGEGHVVISATDLNFRTWPRVAWTVIANAIYHGPSTEVPAPSSTSTQATATVSGTVE